MKTLLILTAITVSGAFMSGCENNPIDNPPGRVINFKSFVDKSNRGVDITELTDVNFGLFAYRGAQGIANGTSNYSIASNIEILAGGKAYANPSDAIYWPDNGDLIGFYAFAPYSDGTLNGISDITPSAKGTNVFNPPAFTFTVDDEVENQIDLLSARTEKQSPIAAVPMTFEHITTRVAVQAKTSVANWRIAITDVRIENVYNTGRYTFPAGATPNDINGWTITQDASTASYDAPLNISGTAIPNAATPPDAAIINTDTYTPVTSTAAGQTMFLLPQELGQTAQIILTYNIYNASSGAQILGLQAQTVTIGQNENLPEGFTAQWKAGFIMTYKFNFAERPAGQPGSLITFDVAVGDWN